MATRNVSVTNTSRVTRDPLSRLLRPTRDPTQEDEGPAAVMAAVLLRRHHRQAVPLRQGD